MKGGQGKHDRQEGAIKRTEATILAYEEKLKSDKKDDEKKLLKKKIERAQTLSLIHISEPTRPY